MMKSGKMPRKNGTNDREVPHRNVGLIELPLVEAGPNKLLDRLLDGFGGHVLPFLRERTGNGFGGIGQHHDRSFFRIGQRAGITKFSLVDVTAARSLHYGALVEE